MPRKRAIKLGDIVEANGKRSVVVKANKISLVVRYSDANSKTGTTDEVVKREQCKLI